MLINLWDTFGNFVEKYQLKVYRIIYKHVWFEYKLNII